jgi:hypothetical protein
MKFPAASAVLALAVAASFADVWTPVQATFFSKSVLAASRNFGLQRNVIAPSKTNGWFLGTAFRGGSMGTSVQGVKFCTLELAFLLTFICSYLLSAFLFLSWSAT